jgi:organic hydroperoxide reductase OsmC/OhrA
MGVTHMYATRTRWAGSTGLGYDAYDRTHEAIALPVAAAEPTPTPASEPASAAVPHPAAPGADAGTAADASAATAPTSPPALTLTADPAFHGDPAHLNPEQLVLLAASSCQLLSFLAVAARARIDVVAYEDGAVAEMPEEPRPARITRIVLRPRITIRGALPQGTRLLRLVEVAHRECFIANSLSSEIEIQPSFVRAQ